MSDKINDDRRSFLGTAAMTIAAAQLGMFASGDAQASKAGELGSLGRANEWLNSQPLTEAGLRGKVVLIDFWTYGD